MKFFKTHKTSMHYCLLITLCLILFTPPSSTLSQEAAYVPEKTGEKLSTEELKTLVAPIALYPDDLLAQMLTASTVPLDIVRAARYQQQNNGATKPPQEALENWEPSVVSLMMFPDTLKMMSDNLDWTEQLGIALFVQEADVYEAIQLLRRQADDAGHLGTNDKQVIVREKEIIRIVPANPEIIYVPVYDPLVIYIPSSTMVISSPYPWITYGFGITIGIGLSYAFDWHHRLVVHHHHWGRPGHHRYHYSRKHPPQYPGRPRGAWRPPPNRPGYNHGNPLHPPRAGFRPPGYHPGRQPRPPQIGPGPSGPPYSGLGPSGYQPGVPPRQPRVGHGPPGHNPIPQPSNSAGRGYDRQSWRGGRVPPQHMGQPGRPMNREHGGAGRPGNRAMR